MRHFTIVALAIVLLTGSAWGQAIPEKIGFQGRLTNASGNPVNGTVNLTFKLYTAGGEEKWSSGALGVTLSGGLYSVELGDTAMSALLFDEPYHLGIQVESDDEMTPRYPLLAAPYAMRAKQANDADMLDGLHATAFATLGHNHDTTYWKLGGNAVGVTGVLGTTSNWPLELIVNGARALRLEPNATSSNVIGGYAGNTVTSGVKGAVIGGGGNATNPNWVTDDYGTVVGGLVNQAGNNAGTTSDATCATVGGGFSNVASGGNATVGGGGNNTASGDSSTIGGGFANTAAGDSATVGGGATNAASGYSATVGGGYLNQAHGVYATVGGGFGNVSAGNYSFAAGRRARANHLGSFVWGDSTDANIDSSANNQFTARATGGVRFVTGVDGAGSPTKTFSIAGSGDVVISGSVTAVSFSGTIGNADQVDSLHAASFLRSDASSALTSGTLTLNAGTSLAISGALSLPSSGITGAGPGSGLNADLLDGQHATAFAAVSHTHGDADISNNLTISGVITGSVIDGSPIGAATPAAGTFTVLNVNGTVTATGFSGDGSTLTGVCKKYVAVATVNNSSNLFVVHNGNTFDISVTVWVKVGAYWVNVTGNANYFTQAIDVNTIVVSNISGSTQDLRVVVIR